MNQLKINNYKKIPLNLPGGFTYTAHTGCVGTADNSLEAIDAGAKYGAQIVEFDLNFTADGVPVLAHDDPENASVTLDEAFKKVSEYDYLKANVDVKSTAAPEKVLSIARKYSIEQRIFFTGIFEKDVDAVIKSCPSVEYYLNIDVIPPNEQDGEYIASLVRTVKACGAVGINFNKDSATRELVEKFRENGLLVSIWTVNNEADMHRILAFAPDNITTRRPDKLRKIISAANMD